MSFSPRNLVCDGPDAFSKILAIGFEPLISSAEASPIYQTINLECSVNGTYSDGDLDYEFSGSTDIPEQTRLEIRSDIGGVDPVGEHYEIERSHDVSTWIDVGIVFGGDYSPNFAALQYNPLGCNGGTPPFAPPNFYTGSDFTDLSIEGTVTDNSTTPPTVTPKGIKLAFLPPLFRGSIQDGDLEMVVSLNVVVNYGDGDAYSETFEDVTDCSAWTTADFRDIRGTYGATDYDSNGIEYVWSVTIG